MDQSNQMDAVFKSSRTDEIDPVSGNEVPVGSMPEEVRDDIPAQLSEGEYVVPADVVRFFGVKLFEDLRTQAKMGFQQMEDNGRIGGEPVEATGMELVQPEDDMDIMFDDADFEVVEGYAEGGVVGSADALNLLSNQSTETMEMREYVNSAGDTISIMFFNGMPMSAIPEGYTYVAPPADPATTGGAVTNAATTPTPASAPAYIDTSEANSPINLPNAPTAEAVNYKELSATELQGLVEDSKGLTRAAINTAVLGINPVMGLAFKAAMWHQRKQVEKEITRRIEDEGVNKTARGQYSDLLEISMEDSPGMWTRLFGSDAKKDKAGLGEYPFDPTGEKADSTDLQTGIDSALEEAMSYTGGEALEAPIPVKGPMPIPEAGEVFAADNNAELSALEEAGRQAGKEARQTADAERRKRKEAVKKAAAEAARPTVVVPVVPKGRTGSRSAAQDDEYNRSVQAASVARSEARQGLGSSTPGGRTTSSGSETYSSKVKRGGGFAKGGLMKK